MGGSGEGDTEADRKNFLGTGFVPQRDEEAVGTGGRSWGCSREAGPGVKGTNVEGQRLEGARAWPTQPGRTRGLGPPRSPLQDP